MDLNCEGQIKSFNQAGGPRALVDLLMGGNSTGVEEEALGVGEGCGDVVGEPEEKVLGEGEEDGMSLGKEEPVDGEEMIEEGQVCGSQEEEVKSASSVDMVSGFKAVSYTHLTLPTKRIV